MRRLIGLRLIFATVGAKRYTLKGGSEKMKLNGDHCIKVAIWEGKSSVFWSQIAFYGDAAASP